MRNAPFTHAPDVHRWDCKKPINHTSGHLASGYIEMVFRGMVSITPRTPAALTAGGSTLGCCGIETGTHRTRNPRSRGQVCQNRLANSNGIQSCLADQARATSVADLRGLSSKTREQCTQTPQRQCSVHAITAAPLPAQVGLAPLHPH